MTALLPVLFLSGAAGLVYQVLWMRQLAIVFGATAHAAATTLAIFFLGLAAGSFWWGERAAVTQRPLRTYAWLEVGIAGTALGFFLLGDVFAWLDATLVQLGVTDASLTLTAKILTATVILLPPAAFMGGTLPMLGEHLIRHRDELGRTGALIYAVNTCGGACGAFLAGFYLPAALGVTSAYLVAVAASLATAAAAAHLGRGDTTIRYRDSAAWEAPPATESAQRHQPLAFLSGFAALGLEVLWTRMFAQVLHNSVYSFAAILVTFLVALGIGAAVAHLLCRLQAPPERVLAGVLAAAGIAVGLTPWWFHFLTDGLAYIAPDASWSAYVAAVFGRAALALLVPGILVGTVFPYLLRVVRPSGQSAGTTIGRLAAVNTLGAILGSVAAGFLLLPALGLWGSIKSLALLYLLAAAVIAPTGAGTSAWVMRCVPLAMLFLFATVLDPTRLTLVRLDPRAHEVLYESWESAYGVTAVVRHNESLRIKLDNYYSLGGTAAAAYEQTQADVPLMLHSAPKAVFFLGLGSGITAGASLAHAVERIVVAELVPDVIRASRKYFGPYINGLFEDARVHVVAGDGRNVLRASSATYDVIVGDLFIPWQAGAGSLYSREHFETVRARLAPGGMFAQWVPLYQLSRDETAIIARTLLEVFPQVTIWRGDFLPNRPIVAFIAQAEEAPMNPRAVIANFRHRRQSPEFPRSAILALTGMFYAGNLGANRDLLDAVAVNTDRRPRIEYSAPITHRTQGGGDEKWFVGQELSAWYAELAARVPTDADPYLARLDPTERRYFSAGTSLFASKTALAAGDRQQADRLAREFRRNVPDAVAKMFDGATAP